MVPGLYESLLTARLERILAELPPRLVPNRGALANAESEDRVSRHIARLIARAIETSPKLNARSVPFSWRRMCSVNWKP